MTTMILYRILNEIFQMSSIWAIQVIQTAERRLQCARCVFVHRLSLRKKRLLLCFSIAGVKKLTDS